MNETECRNIYRQAFADPDTVFEDMLFKYCYEYCRTLEVDGKVVSMLFALPCVVDYGVCEHTAVYIYAAATEENSRKKGYMNKLLEKVKNECEFTFLRPAGEPLISYYSKCGFKTIRSGGAFLNTATVIPKAGYKKLLNVSGLTDNNCEFTLMYYSKEGFDLNKINFNYSMN